MIFTRPRQTICRCSSTVSSRSATLPSRRLPRCERGNTIMNERLLTPISTPELERRWAAVRKEMQERGIDALVMQNSNDWLGGYVKWFTDLPAVNGYPKTVIFHFSAPMTLIEMGGFGMVRKLKGADRAE